MLSLREDVSLIVHVIKGKFTLEEAMKAQKYQMGGGLGHAPGACPWEREPVPTVHEEGWAPRPVWTGAYSSPTGFDPRTVASRQTDCAIPPTVHIIQPVILV